MNVTEAADDAGAPQILVLAALAVAVFAGAASMRILDALLPAISRQFGESVGTTSLAVIAYALSYGTFQLIYGPLGDRLGPYRIVSLASMLSAGIALICALAPSLAWLVLARLVAGAIAAAIGPLALTFVGHMTAAAARPVVLARMSSASLLGTMVGQMSSGFISQYLDWRVSFVLIASLFGGAGILLSHVGTRRSGLKSLGRVARNGSASKPGFYRLVRRRRVRLTLILVGSEGFAVYMSLTYVAAMLHGQLSIELASAGVIVGFFGVGGIMFALFAKRMMRWRASQRAVMGGALAGCGLGLLIIAQTSVFAGFCMFCTGLGLSALHNTLQVRATGMAPDAPAAAVSLFASAFFLGQASGAALGGWAFDHYGPALSCGASTAMLVVLGMIVGRSEGKDEAESSGYSSLKLDLGRDECLSHQRE